MKINHKTLSLIIATLCGTCASAYVVGQDTPRSVPKASSGRIGDTSGAPTLAGNMVSASTPKPVAMYSDPAPATQPQSSYVESGYPSENYSSGDFYDDYSSGGYGYNSANYGYSAPYEYGAGSGYHSVAPRSNFYSWVEVESLLWWGKSVTNTPQIVSGPAGTFPTNVISGGEDNPLGAGMMPGMRGRIGTWLDNDQNYSLSASVYGLFTGGESNTFGGGSSTYGVSYFNPIFGNDAYMVNYQVPDGYVEGSVTESNDLDLLGTDISLRTLLMGDTSSRTDLILGYTFTRLDSAYGLNTRTTDYIESSPIPSGTVLTTSDLFRAKNEFHGIHLGLGTEMNSGRFTFSMNGKVALSHLTQRTSVSGQFSETQPGVLPYVENRGLFAQPTNIGSHSDKSFTFLPELNTKLKYQLGRGQFGVGYSVLVFPKVAMASSQLDPTIDFANISGGMIAPNPKFTNETFFLHGLDLSYTLRF